MFAGQFGDLGEIHGGGFDIARELREQLTAAQSADELVALLKLQVT